MKNDVSGLDHFLTRLNKLNNPSEITSKIVGELSDKGAQILQDKYKAIDYDISDNEIPQVFVELENDNIGRVVAQGSGVAYIEFGTGTKGKDTVDNKLKLKKSKLGISPYNSGKHIKKDVPVLDDSIGAKQKYAKVTGWYKPDRALTAEERIRYERWLYGIRARIINPKRLKKAEWRAYKYTHGTQGIVAGQQIFDTARELKKEATKIVKKIVNEELDNV